MIQYELCSTNIALASIYNTLFLHVLYYNCTMYSVQVRTYGSVSGSRVLNLVFFHISVRDYKKYSTVHSTLSTVQYTRISWSLMLYSSRYFGYCMSCGCSLCTICCNRYNVPIYYMICCTAYIYQYNIVLVTHFQLTYKPVCGF